MAHIQKKGGAMPKLSEVLETLAEQGRRLDEADTELSQLILNTEVQLQSRFSVRIWIDISDAQFQLNASRLVFGKQDGKWQLLVETDNYSDVSSVPLLSCPRETRAKVVLQGHLENLLRGAVAQLSILLRERTQAIETATRFLHEIDGIPF